MSPLNLSLFCPLLCFLLTGGSLGTGRVCRICPCTRATVRLTPTHMNADVKIWCSNEVLSTWCRHMQKSCFWLQPVCTHSFPVFFSRSSRLCAFTAEIIFRSQEQTVICLLSLTVTHCRGAFSFFDDIPLFVCFSSAYKLFDFLRVW